jgi:hypothetical protein
LFPFETWVSMLMECSLSISIFNGRNSHFQKNKTVMLNYETHVNAIRIVQKLEGWASSTMFSFKCECQNSTSYLSVFSNGRDIHVSKSIPTLLKCRETCILWKDTINLEATVSCILFLFENWVSMWQEYTLSVSVFKWKKHSLYGT